MAANAGTLMAVGQRTGRTYSIDIYVPDATATFLTWNVSGLAGSGSNNTFQAQEPLIIRDVSIGAAPTAVGCIFQAGGANVNGATLRWANQLAANPNRPKLAIPIPEGVFVGALQF